MPLSPNAKLIYPGLAKLSDPQLEGLAKAAVSWIKAKYGRDITSGPKCENFTSMGEPIIWLSSPPVDAVTGINVNDFEWENFQGYVRAGRDGKLSLGLQSGGGYGIGGGYGGGLSWNQLPGWAKGVNNITVKYRSHGLNQDEYDLYVGSVVSWWLDSNTRSYVLSSESIGDYSYVANTAFLKGVPIQVASMMSNLQPIRAC